ncbi:MAG: PAS domain S-box protein [Cyclobacteriaceae bacterium]|nr:PAS domain S-box protein [Cyclobacteriaceae bacterium]
MENVKLADEMDVESKINDSQKPRGLKNPALRIVIIYFGVGSLWILGGDYLTLKLFGPNINELGWIREALDLVFVALSGMLLFGLIRRDQKVLKDANEDLQRVVVPLTKYYEELKVLNEQLEQANQTIIQQKDEQLNRVLDLSNDAVFSIDLTGNGKHYFSRTISKMMGTTSPEVMLHDKDYFIKRTHPEDREAKIRSLEELNRNNYSEVVYRLLYPDGTFHWINERMWMKLDSDGKQIAHEGIASDITHLKEFEESMYVERSRLRSLIDNIPDYIFIKDFQGRYLAANKPLIELLGLKEEREILGKTTQDILGERGIRFLEDDRRVIYSGQGLVNKNDFWVDPTGQERILLSSKVPIYDNLGNIIGLVGIDRDVTELKKHEEALNLYRENLDLILTHTKEQIVLLDLDGRLAFFNQAFENLAVRFPSGRKPMVGDLIWQIVPEPEIAKKLFQLARNGESATYTTSLSAPEGDFYYEIRNDPVFIDGKVRYVTSVTTDVTERTTNELRLKASEANLKAIFNSTLDSFMLVDANFCVKAFNQAAVHITSRFWAETIYEGAHIVEINSESRRQPFMEKLEQARRGETVQYELMYGTAEDPTWYSIMINRIGDNLDGLSGYCITSHDISAIKQYESQIRMSELRFRTVAEQGEEVLAIADANNVINFVSPNVTRILGYSPEDLLGKLSFTVVNEEDEALSINTVESVQAAGQKATQTIRQIKHKNGDLRWMEGTIINLLHEEGIRGWAFVYRDITYRRERELEVERLTHSLQLFKNAIDSTSIVSRSDLNGRITYANDNFLRVSGYSSDELLGKPHNIVNASYHPASFWKDLWETILAGKPWHGEVKNKAKDGSFYWVESHIIPLTDDQGKINEFLSIRHEITRRKEAEESLMRDQFLMQKASEAAQIGYWTLTLNTEPHKVQWSREVFKIHGVTDEDIIPTPQEAFSFAHPDDRSMVDDHIMEALRQKSSFNFDHRILLRSGHVRWLNSSGQVMLDENGNPALMLGVVQDITERKLIEDILREYNDRYEIVTRATNDIIWDWDIRKDTVEYNQNLQKVLGHSVTQVMDPAKWWKQHIHPDDHSRTWKEIDDVFNRKGDSWDSIYRFESADGQYRFIHDRASVIYDLSNTPMRVIGAMQDISAQMLATEEVRKLSTVASSTENCVVITDPNGMIEWVNPAFTRVMGYSFEEVLGKSTSIFLPKEATQYYFKFLNEKLKERKSFIQEMQVHSKEWQEYWVRLSIAPVYDENDRLTQTVCVWADITEQKQYEFRITNIARELSSLIESANVPIFGLDNRGYIDEWNRVSADITGYRKNEILGKKFAEELLDESQRERFQEMIDNVNTTAVSNFELPVVTQSGLTLILLVSASLRRGTDGKKKGIMLVAQNITELNAYRQGLEKIVEERTHDLNEAMKKEKELVEMKSKFVSIASHEFRTPLSTISLNSGFIRKYKHKLTDEDLDRKIDIIEKQVRHMTYLLDDVLLIGKSEAGKIKVNLTTIELRTFMQNLADEVQQMASDSHTVNVRWNCQFNSYTSDEKLLRNIVLNLLSNAVKFSPEADRVDLSISNTSRHVIIKVRDFGIGIPAEDVGKLFQPFTRGGNVTSIQGTGLGLSIVKKAVELLGGQVELTSNIGDGTEFTIILPGSYPGNTPQN